HWHISTGTCGPRGNSMEPGNPAEADVAAVTSAFAAHRDRLLRAIALRLDRRVSARVDASDILQETYLEAVRRLPAYLQRRDMPLAVWLYWLAREQVLTCHRRQLGADCRDPRREVGPLPAESSACVVQALASAEPGPITLATAGEITERLRLA